MLLCGSDVVLWLPLLGLTYPAHQPQLSRTVETNRNHSLRPGAVLVARRAKQEPAKPQRSPSPPRGADKPSTVTHATESSTQKLFRPLPNAANSKTGWGPIENLTVAALDYQHGKPHIPQQDEAFIELAEWIYDHSQQYRRQQQHQAEAADQQGVAPDTEPPAAAGPAGKGLEYYQRLAAQLLTLHNSSSSNLVQPNLAPQLNTAVHCARQLWNNIPQPDHMPAVRSTLFILTAKVLAAAHTPS